MSDELRRRPVGAIKALERMQREERQAAGPPLPQMDNQAVVIEALRRVTPAAASRWAKPDGDAAYEAFLDSIRADLATSVDPEVQQRMQADSQRFHLDEADQWSSFESPVMKWRIADSCGRIEAAIRRYEHVGWRDFKARVIIDDDRSWTLSELPAVGTLNTGQVMATSTRAQTGEMIILLDNGLFEFAHMLAQLGVMAFHEADSDGTFSEATLQLVSDIVVSQTVIGTCAGAHKRKTPPVYEVNVRALEDAIVTFVVAHEYAHLLNRDFDMHPPSGKSTGTAAVTDLRAKELAADAKGLRITMSAAVTTQFEAAPVWGPVLYLAGLDMLGRAEAAYNHRALEPESQRASEFPKPLDRMMNLLGMIEQQPLADVFGNAMRVAGQAYNHVLFALDIVQPALWTACGKLREYESANLSDPEQVEFRRLLAELTLWSQITGHPLS